MSLSSPSHLGGSSVSEGRAFLHQSKVEPLTIRIAPLLASARHVMHELSQTNWGGFLRPVYKALNSSQATVSGPVAASKTLGEWEYSDLS